uniref:Uncharacterized protein n=1 Tax=Arundo donax TaxID=35708 RepID=A0A0A9A2W5_ARUDO
MPFIATALTFKYTPFQDSLSRANNTGCRAILRVV